jgi:MFS family permease
MLAAANRLKGDVGTASELAAFGSCAAGFVARPLGGAIFGHFDDRIGRMAMLSVTILIIGLGMFLIGCLPTYGQMGIAARLLLKRCAFFRGSVLEGRSCGAHGDRERSERAARLLRESSPARLPGWCNYFNWCVHS